MADDGNAVVRDDEEEAVGEVEGAARAEWVLISSVEANKEDFFSRSVDLSSHSSSPNLDGTERDESKSGNSALEPEKPDDDSDASCRSLEVLLPTHYQDILQNLRRRRKERLSLQKENSSSSESVSIIGDSGSEREMSAESPHDIADVDTGSSYLCVNELPANLNVIRPEKKYVHTRNKRLAMGLNFLVAFAAVLVLGLGVGHFLGWSEQSSITEEIQKSTKRTVDTLKNELSSCKHDLNDDVDEDDQRIKNLSALNADLLRRVEGLQNDLNSLLIDGLQKPVGSAWRQTEAEPASIQEPSVDHKTKEDIVEPSVLDSPIPREEAEEDNFDTISSSWRKLEAVATDVWDSLRSADAVKRALNGCKSVSDDVAKRFCKLGLAMNDPSPRSRDESSSSSSSSTTPPRTPFFKRLWDALREEKVAPDVPWESVNLDFVTKSVASAFTPSQNRTETAKNFLRDSATAVTSFATDLKDRLVGRMTKLRDLASDSNVSGHFDALFKAAETIPRVWTKVVSDVEVEPVDSEPVSESSVCANGTQEKTDWVFERAKSRHDSRMHDRATDWMFERAKRNRPQKPYKEQDGAGDDEWKEMKRKKKRKDTRGYEKAKSEGRKRKGEKQYTKDKVYASRRRR
ncbi:unnamed protein product [Notodromas monacha]|uniref:Uncharacterized protein n=1 Tax=Notodromas monacha TaxID=399045 RepID=A0A7R9BL56_9CRUS|nr:unnamed protein product [Notodromas monacha]CAG0917501.1 unnamed protein product [Notodromas monacha]